MADRPSDSLRDFQVGRLQVDVVGDESGNRAPTTVAPAEGWITAAPKSGLRSGLVDISSRRPSNSPLRM